VVIKLSECLSDHEECCGEYMDSLGLGLTLNCCCICHQCEKVEGMDKVTGHPMSYNRQSQPMDNKDGDDAT
jgi:hypothetical protein